MNFLRLLPVLLSVLLLGAHFFRAGQLPLVLVTLTIPAILLIRRPWAVRIVQVGLIAGGFEWARTTVHLVIERQAIGEPWIRLALILGTVAILTFCSPLVFRSRSLRERYHC